MASSSTILSSSLLPSRLGTFNHPPHQFLFQNNSLHCRTIRTPAPLRVQDAKLPAGVELPKVEPQLKRPFAGFTRTAEIWNSRACMIGLIGTFIVELILNKGILQIIGVDVGKGLDLPL